jgi:CRP/FNR family transcriptional regulator, cyclic AMP receptor protein
MPHRHDVLGTATLLGGPAPVFVQALVNSSVYFMDVARAKRLAQADAAVACALAAETVHRLYCAYEELAGNTFATVKQRIVRHLLDLAACEPDGRLVAPVNQQDLANGVGSVREVVARILQELRAASLVRTSPGLVEIIDPVGMSRELWSRKA